MMRIIGTAVLLRFYTMIASGLYSWTAITQAETIIYRVAHADDFALVAMYAMGVMSFLGAADLFINDLLPKRFVLLYALRDRHLVSMGIAVCFAVQMVTCVGHNLPSSVLPFYAVYVVLVPASAFADVCARYKYCRART